MRALRGDMRSYRRGRYHSRSGRDGVVYIPCISSFRRERHWTAAESESPSVLLAVSVFFGLPLVLWLYKVSKIRLCKG